MAQNASYNSANLLQIYVCVCTTMYVRGYISHRIDPARIFTRNISMECLRRNVCVCVLCSSLFHLHNFSSLFCVRKIRYILWLEKKKIRPFHFSLCLFDATVVAMNFIYLMRFSIRILYNFALIHSPTSRCIRAAQNLIIGLRMIRT